MHKKCPLQLGKTSYKIKGFRHFATSFYMFIFIILRPLSTIQRLFLFIPKSLHFFFVFLTIQLFSVIFYTLLMRTLFHFRFTVLVLHRCVLLPGGPSYELKKESVRHPLSSYYNYIIFLIC